MPREYAMTWIESQKRWTKMHKGQRFYVSCRELETAETKAASWAAANAWWAAKLDQLRPPKPGTPEAARRMLEAYAGRKLDDAEVPAAMLGLADLLPRLPDEVGQTVTAALIGPQQLAVIDAGANSILDAENHSIATIGQFGENWKQLQEQRVSSGSCKASRSVMNQICVDKFIGWIGAKFPATFLDEGKWQAWYQEVLSLPHGIDHKKRIWQVSKNFVRYLAELRAIDLPRNLESRLLTFKSSPKTIQRLTVEEAREFLQAATVGQTKLHALLMLNCGMLAKDISDLRQTDVDWKKGIVERKRSKTSAHENVPVVKYKLWPETFTLLKAHRSNGERVLLTKSGGTWVQEEMVEGKYKRVDLVASCFKWTNRKLKKPVSPKLFRATAASLLAEHPHFKFYGQYFLGQSPRTIADKHYIQPNETEFFAALDWLRGIIFN